MLKYWYPIRTRRRLRRERRLKRNSWRRRSRDYATRRNTSGRGYRNWKKISKNITNILTRYWMARKISRIRSRTLNIASSLWWEVLLTKTLSAIAIHWLTVNSWHRRMIQISQVCSNRRMVQNCIMLNWLTKRSRRSMEIRRLTLISF